VAASEQAERTGGVQSVTRAFQVLEAMAESDGRISLSALATACDLPLPTIHRLVRTLTDLGYVRQEPSRQYALGPKLIRLGESASRLLGTWARPHLAELVDTLGETANLAMLDGDRVVYVGQVPSRHSMRMFTEVGRKVYAHCTAVGKVLLANLPAEQVQEILRRTGMPAQTEHTITDPERFAEELDRIRERGYATDDGEQEVGVRCVAVAVPGGPAQMAISISGPVTRMTDELVARAVPLLQKAVAALAADLTQRS